MEDSVEVWRVRGAGVGTVSNHHRPSCGRRLLPYPRAESSHKTHILGTTPQARSGQRVGAGRARTARVP